MGNKYKPDIIRSEHTEIETDFTIGRSKII